MKKLSILSVLIFGLTLMIAGCGGSGGDSGSGSAPAATSSGVPGGDGSGAPASSSSTPNSAPTAEAGFNQSVLPGDIAFLDGSGSSDPDGDLLTFQWTFVSKPNGSSAAFSDASTPFPYFTVDKAGDYVIQLVVLDPKGAASSPDTVTVSTINSAPIAEAGPDQKATAGQTVTLNGAESWDPDGDIITYSWTMTSKPSGSAAALAGANSSAPTFVADVYGDYTIELVVTDTNGASSAPDSVTVTFGNLKPVAVAEVAAGSDAILIGATAYLDGSASYDPEGASLTYHWSFVTKPAGSNASLAGAETAAPSFVADVQGYYVVSLVVSDGSLSSDPDEATVMVYSSSSAAIQDLREALLDLNGLSTSVFKNRNMKKSLANKIRGAIAMINNGDTADALIELKNDILKKIDGCAKKGTPEHNDWITDCTAQGLLYTHITAAIAKLETP